MKKLYYCCFFITIVLFSITGCSNKQALILKQVTPFEIESEKEISKDKYACLDTEKSPLNGDISNCLSY